MTSTIYILPRIIPQKMRIYLHSFGKRYARRQRLSASGASPPGRFFSCRCLTLFVTIWLVALWVFLSLDSPSASTPNKTPFKNEDDVGFKDFRKAVPGGIDGQSSPRYGPYLDINRFGKELVNIPRRFYENFANAVDHWAGGSPEEQGVGVLEPPDQLETMDPRKLGENGEAVHFKNLNPKEKKLMDEGWERNAFNQYVSDHISLHRSLPEVRDPQCVAKQYDDDLPNTSVVMCFHNEAWSVLLRGVHSIIDRTPKRFLKEIILVDDYSDQEHLKTRLDVYLAELTRTSGVPVWVVRTGQREGLIRARLMGARNATGEVLTFLDSHIECAVGWAEPLLQRIKEDKRHVVCPVIDVIDDTTFKFHYSGAAGTNVGGFDWNLQFNWHAIPERDKQQRKSIIDPVNSPTMAGGLFSVHRGYFEEIGTYDAGMDIWGGENLEISFRVWMCGGTLEILPCSHIGHIFRKRSPYKWKAGENVLKKNSVRLAKVWLDDYGEYYYQRINHELGSYGDISQRVALRKKLGCKSFAWFLENIYPELFVPGEAYSNGEIRNKGNSSQYCLDSAANKNSVNKPVVMYPCHRQAGNQYWMLSKDGEIRRDEMCIDYAGKDPVIFPCHGQKGNQFWVYNPKTKRLQHFYSKKCMQMRPNGQSVGMNECDSDPNNTYQMWDVEGYKHGNIISNEVTKKKAQK